MIHAGGALVVHLGGPRGDRLSISRDGGALEPLTDLGWDARAQAAPQRRVWTDGRTVFILEPIEGVLLDGEVRLRRFLPGGEEQEPVEGAAPEEGGAIPLAFLARALGDDRRTARVVRWGLDPVRGVPTRAEQEIAARGWTWLGECWGTPARSGDVAWYPVHRRGLLRVDAGGDHLLPGTAGAPALVGTRVVVPGSRGSEAGVWVDGAWRALPGGRPFTHVPAPVGPVVAPHGSGGFAVLSRHGGPLGVLDGPPVRLPPGLYGGLLKVGSRLLAVDEREPPRLVAAGF